MIRLNLSREPQWVDLIDGLRVKVAHASPAIMASVQQELADQVDNLEPTEISFEAARLVARRVILDWEGVGDQDGKPVPVSDAAVDALLNVWSVAQEWQVKVMAPIMGYEAEKNGSAPSPNGGSTGARNTARNAKRSAKPARSASTRRKA